MGVCKYGPRRKQKTGKIHPSKIKIELTLFNKTLESPLDSKEKPVNPKRNQPYLLEGLMLKLKFQYCGHLMQRANVLEKMLMLGKIEGRKRKEEKGMTENEMVGWHHRFNEHEFEQTLGDCEGQGSLVCCSPGGHKELGMTEQQQQ